MRTMLWRLAGLLVLTGSLLAQSSEAPQLTYTPSLDVTAMDRTADPCVDFFQFACGGWVTNNPIPADQTSWTTYGKMQDENRKLLRVLLEQAGQRGAARNPSQQKIGDYYASCMDQGTIASLDCELVAEQEVETHSIFVGRVKAPR